MSRDSSFATAQAQTTALTLPFPYAKGVTPQSEGFGKTAQADAAVPWKCRLPASQRS
jgi:hypothetical protein